MDESSSRVVLVIDVPFLCYRAFHTTGSLMTSEGNSTGVLFGFLRYLRDLEDQHQPTHVAFCFDGGCDERRRIWPEYKKKRRDLNPKEKRSRDELMKQVDLLRTRYLHELGYRNVFWQRGYEADDLIAKVCQEVEPGDEAVIVSSDSDLWQLLREEPRVIVWDVVEKRPYTARLFREEWGIRPGRWIDVKALAGCPSDGVVGVKGVGEKRAVKYFRGELSGNTKVYERIKESAELYERNLQLVWLPFPGTRECKLVCDERDRDSWNKLMDELEIKVLKR